MWCGDTGLSGHRESNSSLDRRLIWAAMNSLCPGHRAVIWRAHYLGWTTARIAADLKITEPMANLKLHYAVRELLRARQQMTR
jgi:RNA polymerase sigma-70 factor (ECF subfamily)